MVEPKILNRGVRRVNKTIIYSVIIYFLVIIIRYKHFLVIKFGGWPPILDTPVSATDRQAIPSDEPKPPQSSSFSFVER